MPIRESDPPKALQRTLGRGECDSTTSRLVRVYRSGSIEVVACCVVDEAEHDRRSVHGLGGVASAPILDAMASLPIGFEVEVANLTQRVQRVIADAPSGVADFGPTTVTRRLERPVRVELIGACAPSWAAGLRSLRRTVGLASRILLLPEAVVDDPTVRFEAAIYGIGLATTRGLLVPPSEFKQVRFTTHEWRFKEQLYAAALQNG